jgi:hypothetical protein
VVQATGVARQLPSEYRQDDSSLNLAGKIVHTARRGFLMLSDPYRYQAVWRLAIG